MLSMDDLSKAFHVRLAYALLLYSSITFSFSVLTNALFSLAVSWLSWETWLTIDCLDMPISPLKSLKTSRVLKDL